MMCTPHAGGNGGDVAVPRLHLRAHGARAGVPHLLHVRRTEALRLLIMPGMLSCDTGRSAVKTSLPLHFPAMNKRMQLVVRCGRLHDGRLLSYIADSLPKDYTFNHLKIVCTCLITGTLGAGVCEALP